MNPAMPPLFEKPELAGRPRAQVPESAPGIAPPPRTAGAPDAGPERD